MSYKIPQSVAPLPKVEIRFCQQRENRILKIEFVDYLR